MPRPLDATVTLRETPARRVAVLRFNGLATQSNIDEHVDALRHRIAERGEQSVGPVTVRVLQPTLDATLGSTERSDAGTDASVNSPRLTVWFDGACPLCRGEIRLIQRLDRRKAIHFIDIGSGHVDCPIDRKELLQRFHPPGAT